MCECQNLSYSGDWKIHGYHTCHAGWPNSWLSFSADNHSAECNLSALSVSAEAMNSRLKTYLKEAGIDEGETAHSFRSGCDKTLALSGSVLAHVMTNVGLERSHTATYYMQLVLCWQRSEQPGTFKCSRARCKTWHFICNVNKLSGPKRSIKITDHLVTQSSSFAIVCWRQRNIPSL